MVNTPLPSYAQSRGRIFLKETAGVANKLQADGRWLVWTTQETRPTTLSLT